MLNQHFTSFNHLLDQINSFKIHPEPTGQALFFDEPFEVYGLVIPEISFEIPSNNYLVSYVVAQRCDPQTICYWAYGNPLRKDGDKLVAIPQKFIIRIFFHEGNPAAIVLHKADDVSEKPYFQHILNDSNLPEIPNSYVNVYLNSIQQQFHICEEYKELFKSRLESINKKKLPNYVK